MKELKYGLQLFSVRNEIAADMAKTLENVAKMGYSYVEFAGYFEKSPAQIRKMLDSFGLKCISVHQGLEDFIGADKQKHTDFLREIGAEYAAVPWINPEAHAGGKDYLQTVKNLQGAGRFLKDEGINLLYHNHEFEFEKFSGEYKLDILFRDVPADVLGTEIDVCWAQFAGQDPAEYIRKYDGRCPIIHLKDFVFDDTNKRGLSFKPTGYGVVDFKEVINAALNSGTEYFITEPETNEGDDELEYARLSIEYLQSLKI